MTPDDWPVVVVEDSDDDFDTVGAAARRAGVGRVIRRATSGGECLALMRGPGPRPAIVIMDLNTPGSDGREALAAIKADPELMDVPVVVLTTSNNPRDVLYCYKAGANAYHVKPVSYPDHLSVVEAMLNYWLAEANLPDAGGHG